MEGWWGIVWAVVRVGEWEAPADVTSVNAMVVVMVGK